MKKILIILIFGISMTITACKHSDKKVTEVISPLTQQAVDLNKVLKDSANFTTMQWPDSTFQDLGKVEEGQVVEVAFRFKNTGDKPLIIASVSVGCGCTTITERPKEPLRPGQEGVIKAKFDSKNLPGERLKEIYVGANTKKSTSHILIFRVEVVKK
jgi:uncharacterized protein YxeA